MSKYKQRADGRYATSITVNGKKKSLIAKTSEELDKKVTEYKYLSYKGFIAEDESITMKDFSLKWLELHSLGKADGTIMEFSYLIKKHIIPNIGFIKIKDLKIYNIKQLVNDMCDKEIENTAKKTLQLIKRILNDAVDNDIIYKNISQNIKNPKIIKESKKPLTMEEDKLLLKNGINHKYGTFFLLMRYTGMRKEEIVALNVNDIDLNKKTIFIGSAADLRKNQPKIKETKNRKTRIVPIPNFIIDIITDQINEAKFEDRESLFSKESNKKERLSQTAVRRHLESFLYSLNSNQPEDKKIKFTCHQLRHSYCTMLYYSGIKIKKAQELMGHSSAKMVYDIYAHLDEERETADKDINKYINKNIISSQKVVKCT